MGWSVGYDEKWRRDIGYGVPAWCDHPACEAEIDRGLAFVCGSSPFGGEHGCGLYFCQDHLWLRMVAADELVSVCERCAADEPPFEMKPDAPVWVEWKLTHHSWARWREENPTEVERLTR